MDTPRTQTTRTTRPLMQAGVLLGIGLGGFVDGIVLHQILQWHHMLTAHGDYPSTTVVGLEVNTLWDGLFHASTWLITVAGLGLLWRAGSLRGVAWVPSVFMGALLAGWALFNLVEGVVDHHILTLHHVRDDVDDPLPWDLGFLGVSVVMLAAGVWLMRRGAAAHTR